MRHRPAGGAACSDEAIRACLTVKVLSGLPLRQTTVRQASPSRACCGWRRWTGRYRITVRCVGDSGPWRSDCPTGDRRGRCICWWTAPGSQSAARVLGMPASMVALAGAFVGRSTWGSTKRRWRSGRSRVHWRLVDVYVDGPEEPVDKSQFGDAPVVPDLIGQIPMAESIGSVTADGAYDTRRCHDAIADRGDHAVIPPRRNDEPCRANGLSDNGECHGSRTPPAPQLETKPGGRRNIWADPSGGV